MKQDLESLNLIFSKARLGAYSANCDKTDDILDKYHKNIIFSEAMIPTLHYFEICLRNRIDQMLKRGFGNNWLMNPNCELMISKRNLEKISEIISKSNQKNKRNVVHDDIVAQMTLGFWSSFSHKKYDTVIWHNKDRFKMVFPNLARVNRTRPYIESRILKIKAVRNRIAHHELILDSDYSIVSIHKMCYELIEAMSLEAINFLKTIDRFAEVYTYHAEKSYC